MPTHSTYSSSVDVATGAVLSKEADRKEELDRINNLL